MKKKFLIVIIIISMFIIIIAPFITMPIINDFILDNFANNLFVYPLPPKTILIKQDKQIGWLDNGNGDGVDFAARIIIETELSKQELQDYYSKTIFPNPKKAQAKNYDGVKPDIVQLNKATKWGEGLYGESKEITDPKVPANQYIIQIIDGNYNSFFDYFDYRCAW